MTGSAGSLPQSVGAAIPATATVPPILAVAVPTVPATGATGQGLTAPSVNPAGGNDPSGIGNGGLPGSGSTLLSNAAASAVTLSQAPGASNNTVGTMPQVAQPNATGLVPIAPNTPSPTGAATDPAPFVATGRQLGSAIGGSTGLGANPGVAGAPFTPTPLTVTQPLPPIQASGLVAGVPEAWSSGGHLDSGVLPASLPEPGGLAMFAVILVGAAMTIRRLRSRG